MGRSALYETSSQGKTEAVRLLLQNKADVNLPTEVIIRHYIRMCFTSLLLTDIGWAEQHSSNSCMFSWIFRDC